MSILYDLRYVPFGLSVLATLLWGFYVLSQDRRDTRTLKACQLLRVRFRLGFLLLFSSHVFLSLITRVVFLALTITLETDPWTVYLLGSIICQCMISQCIWTSGTRSLVQTALGLFWSALGLSTALVCFLGGAILGDTQVFYGSTIMLVSAVSFRLWMACEWAVFSRHTHQVRDYVFIEAFTVSSIVAAGILCITCAKTWDLVPVLRLYILLVLSCGYGIQDLLAAVSAIRNKEGCDEWRGIR